MKKKLIPAALTLALVLAVCVTGAFAAHGGFGRGSGTCLSVGRNFIDQDGDGVRDNRTGGQCLNGGQCVNDLDGDGLCDVCGSQFSAGGQCLNNGQCVNDLDGDGLCDNWASRPMDGTGLGHGRGHHSCHG